MRKSDRTKHLSRWYRLIRLLSVICCVAPLTYFTIDAFLHAEPSKAKILTSALCVCLAMTIWGLIRKHHIRTVDWVLILALYTVLDKMYVLVVVMTVTTALDEFVLTPLYKSLHAKVVINKEIDRRSDV